MAENRGAGSSYHRAQNQESGQAAYWRYVEGSLSMHEGVSAFERGSQHDKYHTMQGHGFAAEDANALNDIFHGRKVSKVGTSNTKNGADRIVDGVEIQVKYCQSAEATVDSLFDRDGTFRYGKMKVEVPKEQAESVRQQLRERAQAGRLRDSHGNTIRPEQIDDMVQEGSVTYQQAQNIAKAGNLDSLWFDVKNSAISCSCIFGLSFAVNMAQQLWSGADLRDAAMAALKQSFAVGLGSLVVSVTSQQLLRTSASSVGKVASRYMVHGLYQTQLGKTAIEKLASYSLGKSIYGAAAVNHTAKLLRSNVVTGVITTAVLTAPDLYRAAISKTASWQQLGKNLAVNAASVAGGTAGWMGGAAAGAALGSFVPGVGTAIGGFLGGVLGALGGGCAAGAVTKAVADEIVADDSQQMLELCQDAAGQVAFDYMLTMQETERFVDKLHDLISADFLRDMYGSSSYNCDRRLWAYHQFERIAQSVVQERRRIILPSEQDLLLLTAQNIEDLEQELSATAY